MNTGIEVELVLPEGTDRLQLAAAIAQRLGCRVEYFLFPSKIPVPYRPLRPGENKDTFVDELTALMEDVAKHHQARIQSVAPNGRYFYLVHRAGRILSTSGTPLLDIVHDNTLSGGERVAELVTAPLFEEPMHDLLSVALEEASQTKAIIPNEAALHIHVEATSLRSLVALQCLVHNFTLAEPLLRRLLQTPATFKNAASLPTIFVEQLESLPDSCHFSEVCHVLKPLIPGSTFGLNLYNLLHGVVDKPTVELKLAKSSLNLPWVMTVRQLFVSMVEMAHQGKRLLPGDVVSEGIFLSAYGMSIECMPQW